MSYPPHPDDEQPHQKSQGLSRGAIGGIIAATAFLALMVLLHLTGTLGESLH